MNKLIVFFLGVFLSSCGSFNDSSIVKDTMREVNGIHERLFSYVWSKGQFEDPSNKDEILSLMSDLRGHFDKLKTKDVLAKRDPSFLTTIEVEENLIKEAYDKFNLGELAYAKYQLKGMTENCITCHSRFEVASDFYGKMPLPEGTDFEDRLRVGEFLVATRQFSRAEEYLLNLAMELSELTSGSKLSLDAIKLWLLVEVRVKEHFHGSASSLSAMIDKPAFQGEDRDLLSKWVVDLQTLQVKSIKGQSSEQVLMEVNKILQPDKVYSTLREYDLNFVNTARSSSLLHELLLVDLSAGDRKAVLTNLAVVYSRMPLNFLKHLAPMYEELVIRTYPHTKEARLAYQLFKQQFEFNHTGSGGEVLSSEDKSRVEELGDLSN